MMIDEAIDFCKEKSKNIKLKTEPQTFVMIADMLEELKAIENGFTDDLLNMGYTKGYNKAICDCIDMFADWYGYGYETQGYYRLLQQLKGGIGNDK